MMPNLTRTVWRKSSRSAGNAHCVELACAADVTGVRDSKNPSGPVLTFGQAELVKLLRSIKAGRLDG